MIKGKGWSDIIVPYSDEYYNSNIDKSISQNKSYIINNDPNVFHIDNKSCSFNKLNNNKKAKSFSLNKSRINNLALKYNILNYDISYRMETFRVNISDINENKTNKVFAHMKLSLINKINKKTSSGTEKENQSLIENNYLDKYNIIKSYLG